jgi:hypothetical protein
LFAGQIPSFDENPREQAGTSKEGPGGNKLRKPVGMGRPKLPQNQPAPDWKGGQQTLFGAPRPEAPVLPPHPRDVDRAERAAAKAEKRALAVDDSGTYKPHLNSMAD